MVKIKGIIISLELLHTFPSPFLCPFPFPPSSFSFPFLSIPFNSSPFFSVLFFSFFSLCFSCPLPASVSPSPFPAKLCQTTPATQVSVSPPLPTADVCEMGTDVAEVSRGAGGCGVLVCVICVRLCVGACVSMSVSASCSNLC